MLVHMLCCRQHTQCAVQVFFEYKTRLDMTEFHDALKHVGECAANPLAIALTPLGLYPGAGRQRRNYRAMRSLWRSLVEHAFAQPEPPETKTAFWACLRRAFPNAMTDDAEMEKALANTGLMYGASSETTITSLSGTLSILAVDAATTAKLVEVRPVSVLHRFVHDTWRDNTVADDSHESSTAIEPRLHAPSSKLYAF